MENKYITVAYKLYAITDGQKELVEEAPAAHPFQFITGVGYTLDRFEKEIAALNQENRLTSLSLVRKLTENVTKTTYVRCPNPCSVMPTASSTKKTSSRETSSC